MGEGDAPLTLVLSHKGRGIFILRGVPSKWDMGDSEISSIVWWGRGDSNPHALRHMILSHARLPIPTLPREEARTIVP